MESSPSNISKSLFSNEESQESGWTIYFDDFFNSSQRSTTSYNNNSITDDNSLISDAASSSSVAYCKIRSKKKLSFKKKKTVHGGVLDDDSLEDTASSPVNSPKVGDMNVLNMNQTKKDEPTDLPQEKNVCFQNCPELTKDGFGFVDGENESTELQKRGLCLVPLSMLVDYLG